MITPEAIEHCNGEAYAFLVQLAAHNPAGPAARTYAALALAYQQRTANYIAAVDAGLVKLQPGEVVELNKRLGRT